MSIEVVRTDPTHRRENWIKELQNIRPQFHKHHWTQAKADLIREIDSVLQDAEVQGREFTESEQRWYDTARGDLEFVNGRLQAFYD